MELFKNSCVQVYELKKRKIMSTYAAIVCAIKVRPHPNADRLQLGSVHGHQVIISLETKDGELGVFFPCDGQLSQEFAEANDLISRVDENGNKAGGYFDKTRRVRAQNFRGEKSEGFWCPISYLNHGTMHAGDCAHWDDQNIGLCDCGLNNAVKMLKEGDTFTELNDVPICNKYVTPATQAAQGQHIRRTNKFFAKHADTKQFRYELENIKPGSIITITEKLHGTSARMAYVLDPVKPKWWEKVLMSIGALPTKVDNPREEFKLLTGSRNVILDDLDNKNFRQVETEFLQPFIRKNEIWYGEIIGQTTDGSDIMPAVSFDKIQNKDMRKDLKKRFGDYATFHYGVCWCDFYVYRITVVTDSGEHAYDLPWPVVKRRAEEAMTAIVPELAPTILYQGNTKLLTDIVDYLVTDLDSVLAPRQLREGIVLRVDDPSGYTYWLKDKTFIFKVLEGIAKEDDTYVDTEEIA